MFFFGFLIVIAIYILILVRVTALMPPKVKTRFVMTVIAIPVSFPFWHYIYPSYYTFRNLCASPDRNELNKTVEVDYVYLDRCYSAYKVSRERAFKGYECPITFNPKSYTRFVRSSDWDSVNCHEQCVQRGYYANWEDLCQSRCFKATQIPEPSFQYKVVFDISSLIEGRLVEHKTQFVDNRGEDLATFRDYFYLPYGDGLGRIFGLASGSAPSLSCAEKNDPYQLGFLKPRRAQ